MGGRTPRRSACTTCSLCKYAIPDAISVTYKPISSVSTNQDTQTHPTQMRYRIPHIFKRDHTMIDITVMHPREDHAEMGFERSLVDSEELEDVWVAEVAPDECFS